MPSDRASHFIEIVQNLSKVMGIEICIPLGGPSLVGK